MKIITHISIVLLSLLFCASAQAEITTATDSATQKLTLTILPAFESLELASGYDVSVQEIVASKTIAVRSNTPWQLDVYPWSYGFVNSGYCFTQGTIGLSNGAAGVGDSYQLVELTCVQPRSWGDDPNAVFEIEYTAGAGLTL